MKLDNTIVLKNYLQRDHQINEIRVEILLEKVYSQLMSTTNNKLTKLNKTLSLVN